MVPLGGLREPLSAFYPTAGAPFYPFNLAVVIVFKQLYLCPLYRNLNIFHK